MKNTTKTIYAIDLELSKINGDMYKILPNTRLNEKYNILEDDMLIGKEYPTLKYFTIGNGGSSIVDDNILTTGKHSCIDGALYNHIPFVVKRLEDDLNSIERLNYRFRKIFTKDNNTYVAYYLKTIDKVLANNAIYNIEKVNDKFILKPFDNMDNKILQPVPRTTEDILSKSSKYVISTSLINIKLSVDELKNIKSGYELMFNKGLTDITELALCTGVDRFDGINFEASSVQVNYFVDVGYSINDNINKDEAVFENIDIGGMEPLIR